MSKKVVIRKYPNRKLYNSETASYVSYKDIVEMIKAGDTVTVIDHRTKEDITRFTLTQIRIQKERQAAKTLPETTLETIDAVLAANQEVLPPVESGQSQTA